MVKSLKSTGTEARTIGPSAHSEHKRFEVHLRGATLSDVRIDATGRLVRDTAIDETASSITPRRAKK